MAQQRPFPVDPELTQIAMAYTNERMIGDAVLPRVPVGKKVFKYTVYNKEDRFTVPDTEVGRKSRTNEVEFGASEDEASTRDHGLEDPIPQDDIDHAAGRFNPVEQAVESISDIILLGREVRVANLVMNESLYATSNKKALATPWTDPASDPIGDIHLAQDTVIMPVNVLTLGQAEWRALSKHPAIVKAVHGNSGDSGVATKQQVAELLELDEIQVGRGRINTANKGQPMSLQRAWSGVHLQHRADNINSRNGLTFGFTGEYGGRQSAQWFDRNIGAEGGQRVRVWESLKELITAPDLGYLITGAV